MKEEALTLGPYRSLVGVLTPASQTGSMSGVADGLCVVLLNAGLIHHAGPHRLHVKLARALAARGVAALRVDLSGIGDSLPRPDGLPAARLGHQEPREILDDLAQRGYDRFVLFGVCSSAKHALQGGAGDPRVQGLVLVNQESTEEDPAAGSRASAQYYVRRSARNPRAWLNLFTGRVRYKALLSTFARVLRHRLRGAGECDGTLGQRFRAELEPALKQDCRLLVVFSDRHAQFAELLGTELADLERDGRVEVALEPDADHLFTGRHAEERLMERVCGWIGSFAEQPLAVAAGADWDYGR